MAEALYKILVVDDEPDLEPLVLMRMRKEIKSGLYTFLFAGNGEEALATLKQEEGVDMVLSDINMPKMDGLTLLEQIAATHHDLSSVIISAYGDMKNIRSAMNKGAFDFIIKPIDFEDFRVTISRALGQLAQLREALASKHKLALLERELDVANTIQQSILPDSFPSSAAFQIDGRMAPAREVGGDFYYVEPLADGRISLAIADVSDKGIPAALFMMLTRSLLKGTQRQSPEPSQVMEALNKLLHEDNDTSMFVTLFYAIYDPKTGAFAYANGGHNPPFLVRQDGQSEPLPMTDGMALGVVPDLAFKEASLTLAPGESVFLYTDGVTEAVNQAGEEFGVARVKEQLARTPKADAKKINEGIFQAVKDFAGDTPQFDDITCLAFHRKADAK